MAQAHLCCRQSWCPRVWVPSLRDLQLAVEFSDSDREQYQQFEGEQPNVLERINSEPGEPVG